MELDVDLLKIPLQKKFNFLHIQIETLPVQINQQAKPTFIN